jgi:L-threonylcarbamoyladenylate synthase
MTSQILLDTSGAVNQLQQGNIIAYPTEAVYGLGCDPRNETALRCLLKIKARPVSAGFVLIASDYDQLRPWVADVEPDLIEQAMQRWPGPVTWLFPRAAGTPDLVAGDHATIAVRITAHEPSRELCEAYGSALISSSANTRSAEPARSVAELTDYFGNELGGILAGSLGGATRPSEIRDLVSGTIVRRG